MAWTGVLIFDILIFSLTLYKAFTIGRGIKLLDVIVRDGASNQVLPCTFKHNPSISHLRCHVLLVRATLFIC